jgi:hypothetical protein
LNLVTPDVIASSGDGVSRLRLWAWLFEMSIYFWAVFGGLSDVGIGLAAMVGVRAPENFVRPWAATTPLAFWRRALATVTARIRRHVAVPIARRAGVPAGVLASFLVGALWYSMTVLALYGVYGIAAIRPGAWAGWGSGRRCMQRGVVVLGRDRDPSSGAACECSAVRQRNCSSRSRGCHWSHFRSARSERFSASMRDSWAFAELSRRIGLTTRERTGDLHGGCGSSSTTGASRTSASAT